MAFHKLEQDLVSAEALLAENKPQEAVGILSRLAEDAEEYVDKNYNTTQEVQYFSFPSLFDKLAYKRVEKDPRKLIDVEEPLDRLYADLAFALIQTGDYSAAQEALKLAIRWNPMNCGARLDLAELARLDGTMDEWLALTYSVFARASHAPHLARAYTNFAYHFQAAGKPQVAAACLYLALRFNAADKPTQALLQEVKAAGFDPAGFSAEKASALVEAEGIPDGANAEIAVCLLMCATDVAQEGNKKLATQFTMQARDLVGEKAAAALLELILESGDETE